MSPPQYCVEELWPQPFPVPDEPKHHLWARTCHPLAALVNAPAQLPAFQVSPSAKKCPTSNICALFLKERVLKLPVVFMIFVESTHFGLKNITDLLTALTCYTFLPFFLIWNDKCDDFGFTCLPKWSFLLRVYLEPSLCRYAFTAFLHGNSFNNLIMPLSFTMLQNPLFCISLCKPLQH